MKRLFAAMTAALAVAQGFAVPNDARRAEAEAEARAVIEKLSPDEKVEMLMMDNPEIKRLGLPRFHWWSEALHGYARSGLATKVSAATCPFVTGKGSLSLGNGLILLIR